MLRVRSLRPAAVLACVVVLLATWSPSASATTGGPDAFGYTFTDSSEPGGPHGGFIELGGNGGQDIGLHCDDCTKQIQTPFPVTVYGHTTSTLNVSSDGNLQIGSDVAGPALEGLPEPRVSTALFPFSADLTLEGNSNVIWTDTLGNAPHRQFAIEWFASTFRTDLRESFEVVFTEGSPSVDFEYGVITPGAYPTVGIQGDGGDGGNYLVYPDPVGDSSGVRFTPPPNASDTTTTLAVNPSPISVLTQRVRLTARVAPAVPGGAVPTGTVTFTSQYGDIGTASVGPSGRAVVRTTGLRPRLYYQIYAFYSGDENYSGSTSSDVSHYVGGVGTTTKILLPDRSTISASTPVTATVTVDPPGRNPVTSGDASMIWTDASTGREIATTTIKGGKTTLPGGSLPISQVGAPRLLLQARISSPPGRFEESGDQVRVRVAVD